MDPQEATDIARFILDNLKKTREIPAQAYKIKTHLIPLCINGSLSEPEFYSISSLLTPQARSPMWQNYFIKKYACEKIKSDLNKGDFKKNNTYYEYKASGYNQDNALHIVQIRLWQECDYVIQSITDAKVVTFVIEHREMNSEKALLCIYVAHGKKAMAKVNQHNELRGTVFRDTAHWDRWDNKYFIRLGKLQK